MMLSKGEVYDVVLIGLDIYFLLTFTTLLSIHSFFHLFIHNKL